MLPVALLVLALPFVAASPLGGRNMIVHERREAVPSGFVKLGSAPESQVINLRLSLVQGDMAGLEDRLMAVSTPSSAEYGQFLSKEQVEAFVAPKQDTIDAINKFLSENDLKATTASPAGDVLSISVPVSKANELFGAQFDTFKHTETNKETVRTLEYSIPAELKGHLDFVHPTTTYFPSSSFYYCTTNSCFLVSH
jgi:tripeptidyl-peptidase I